MKKRPMLLFKTLFTTILFFPFLLFAQTQEWLLHPIKQKATITVEEQNIILDNGLLQRVFKISSNLACIKYTNLSNGQELLRSIEPEAKVVLNNIPYNVGGLSGQKEKAYLKLDSEKNLYNQETNFIY